MEAWRRDVQLTLCENFANLILTYKVLWKQCTTRENIEMNASHIMLSAGKVSKGLRGGEVEREL